MSSEMPALRYAMIKIRSLNAASLSQLPFYDLCFLAIDVTDKRLPDTRTKVDKFSSNRHNPPAQRSRDLVHDSRQG